MICIKKIVGWCFSPLGVLLPDLHSVGCFVWQAQG